MLTKLEVETEDFPFWEEIEYAVWLQIARQTSWKKVREVAMRYIQEKVVFYDVYRYLCFIVKKKNVN